MAAALSPLPSRPSPRHPFVSACLAVALALQPLAPTTFAGPAAHAQGTEVKSDAPPAIYAPARPPAAAAPMSALPDLGDESQSLVSPAQERKLGESVVRQIRAAGAYLEDPEVNDYLNDLGQRLVVAVPDTTQSFEFFAVGDPSINAFALPGGYVGVNTGLILLTQTESELAAVLAHEITHVTQHHFTRAMAGQQRSLALHARGARRRDRRIAVALVVGRAGHERRDRVGAGDLDPEPTQLHARERVRGRPHRVPAARRRRLRRHGNGVDDAAAAEADALRRGQRAVVSAHAPDHLRADRRGSGTRAGEALPADSRLARLPDGPRAAQELYGHAAGGGRVVRRSDQGAQVQQRGRRALRARRVAAARQRSQAREGRARRPREDGAAASDGRGDGRSRLHGVRRSRRRDRALPRRPRALPEQDAARL